jgi:hypothetical protein
MNNPPEPTHVIVHRVPAVPASYRTLSIAGWILIALTCGLALVPLLGFASWIIAAPVFLATFIMAIIILTRGGTLPGILLLLTSIFFGPITVAVAPFVTSLLTAWAVGAGAAVHESELSRHRSDAIVGRWRRDNGVLIDYLSDGTFRIGAPRSATTGQWHVSGDDLTLSISNRTETETIASISSTQMLTRDQHGKEHIHTKVPQ